jgi:hypothetical protein
VGWDWNWIVFWLIPWTPTCNLACASPRCLYQSSRYIKNCKDSIIISEKQITLLYTITTKSLLRHLEFNGHVFVRMYIGSREICYLELKRGTILRLDRRWHKRHPLSAVCEFVISKKDHCHLTAWLWKGGFRKHVPYGTRTRITVALILHRNMSGSAYICILTSLKVTKHMLQFMRGNAELLYLSRWNAIGHTQIFKHYNLWSCCIGSVRVIYICTALKKWTNIALLVACHY